MNQRGVVMVTALAIVTVLTTLGAAFLIRSLNESFQGHRTVDRGAAFYLAEAGVDQAVATLSVNPDPAALVGLTQNLGGAQPLGSFTIESATQLSPNVFQVVSRGVSQNEIRRVETVLSFEPETLFQYSLFADELLEGSMLSDSYDSRLGVYNDDPTDSIPDNSGQNGDLGTNGTDFGDLTITNTAFIEGQLAVGPNVNPPESIVDGYNPALITGDPEVISQPDEFPMPPVSVPAGLTCSPLTLNGQDEHILTATGGPLGDNRYCYTDINITGGAVFSPSSDVIVYVTGNVVTRGNTALGNTAHPSYLALLLTSTAVVTLEQRGTSRLYGAVYGPEIDMTISGNAEFFGSLIVDRLHIPGSATVHYDEALVTRTDVSNQSKPTVISWRDLN
jgi:hypothetical protein